MKFEFDWLALGFAVVVGLVSNNLSYFGKLNRILLRCVIRFCITVTKTSKFKELHNIPLKHLSSPFPNNEAALNEILKAINTDPNLKYSGVHTDVSLIIQCIFDDKDELLVDTMDNLVISKLGVASDNIPNN